MSRSFYYDDDEHTGEGYPYRDSRGDYHRSPYEERRLLDTSRENDPYASPTRSRHSPFTSPDLEARPRRGYQRDEPPPLITRTSPPRERERSLDRDSRAPEDRREQYGRILRHSETPPPGPRASRRRIDAFSDTFGQLERPVRGSGERNEMGNPGPPRDPFRQPQGPVSELPYGGGPPPRDPFRPGGAVYDYERKEGHPHPAIDPPPFSTNEQRNRRHNHYRSGVGEDWGVARDVEYGMRRRHEDQMLLERERDEERYQQRRHENAIAGDRRYWDNHWARFDEAMRVKREEEEEEEEEERQRMRDVPWSQ